MSGAPEDLRENSFQQVMVLDDRIFVEEAKLFEKRQSTNAEEWRISEATRSDVRQAAHDQVLQELL